MGIVFLIICFVLGYCLVKNFLEIKNPIVVVSGAFLVGCLVSGTILYLLDCLFAYTIKNYLAGNIIYTLFALMYIVYCFRKPAFLQSFKKDFVDFAILDKWVLRLTAAFLAFSLYVTYVVFSPQAGGIKVVGAYSDIMFHHAFARSVSLGNNIPVEYPYFANSQMNYHFLFDYFTGKISQFSLNSVHSMNIVAAISFTFLLLLIYQFGCVYFKSKATGVLGSLFLLFHSSISIFPWLKANWDSEIVNKFLDKVGYVDGAMFESWGLFNLNVYINQKHFILTMAFLVFIVHYILEQKTVQTASKDSNINYHSMKRNVFIAVLVGMTPYWNVIIAGICIAFLGLFAFTEIKNKKFFFGLLYSAVIASIIVIPQMIFFKSGDTVLSEYPRVLIGYAVGAFLPLDILTYYFKVFGLKLILIFGSLALVVWKKRFEFFIFIIPFIMANTLQFGKVLFDNNKLIITWLLFANCFAAYVVIWLFKKLPRFLAFVPAILIIALMLGGFSDFFAYKNMGKVVMADNNSQFKQWIVKNTKPHSVFLTSNSIPPSDNAISTICLSGRKLYVVRNNVDASCNIDPRLQTSERIYNCIGDPQEIISTIQKEQIDYIMIDDLAKSNESYKINWDFFDTYFDKVYDQDNIAVYTLKKFKI